MNIKLKNAFLFFNKYFNILQNLLQCFCKISKYLCLFKNKSVLLIRGISVQTPLSGRKLESFPSFPKVFQNPSKK